MKYIVTDTEGKEELFIFPEHINHDAMAEVLSYIKTGDLKWVRKFREPIRAGFIRGGVASGRSETLNLDSSVLDSLSMQDKGSSAGTAVYAPPAPSAFIPKWVPARMAKYGHVTAQVTARVNLKSVDYMPIYFGEAK